MLAAHRPAGAEEEMALAGPATKRSGVRKIEVELVGTAQKWRFSNVSCAASSCTLSGTVQIKLTEGLSAGLHKVKIFATDFVNNKEAREIEFEYLPATGIDGNGVLQRFPLPDGNTQEGHICPELAVNVINGNLVFHQRDINVEGPEASLEIERFYNSQLPQEQSTEWAGAGRCRRRRCLQRRPRRPAGRRNRT